MYTLKNISAVSLMKAKLINESQERENYLRANRKKSSSRTFRKKTS